MATKIFNTGSMRTDGISWDSRQLFINDDYLAELINDDVEEIVLVTPKGRYTTTTEEILDISGWVDKETRAIPFSRITRG